MRLLQQRKRQQQHRVSNSRCSRASLNASRASAAEASAAARASASNRALSAAANSSASLAANAAAFSAASLASISSSNFRALSISSLSSSSWDSFFSSFFSSVGDSGAESPQPPTLEASPTLSLPVFASLSSFWEAWSPLFASPLLDDSESPHELSSSASSESSSAGVAHVPGESAVCGDFPCGAVSSGQDSAFDSSSEEASSSGIAGRG
mmetsp:Transcript_79259/g.175820  ORF Transcript_79259/g.175820 Transcript_79259/m.175820 type:complete len:210 (-) Transcript_79259:108-737(-)